MADGVDVDRATGPVAVSMIDSSTRHIAYV
jgi:hypothetical protein